ncbi:MAG: 50S ribosomal protein L11 methyltransferase [Candidatus Competibacteraceae bacterium]|nr:50S ribosomal protein L11 methyltransferase [Candidatus Competibacteraceae bacterium]
MNRDWLTRTVRRTLPAARILETPLPLCPDLRLYLIDPDNMERPFTSDEIQIILANTPYWIFCWAAGQALAHYLLHNPSLVAGRCVVDFGAGSGVVAIAAAMAGAAKVIACDIDPDALGATKANAALNGTTLHTCETLDEIADRPDLIIAADVLYDSSNRHFLELFLNHSAHVLVADSRVKNLDQPPYRKIEEISASTLPDLQEPEAFNRVSLYRAESEST